MKNQMFQKFLTLAMAAVMLLGCVGMLAGCSGDKDPFAGLTDAEYMKAVEKANMADAVEGLTAFYGALGKTDTKLETNAKVDYTVQLGDMIIDMLEESYQESMGSAMDFSFLSNIGFQEEITVKGERMKENIALLLNNQKILSATLLMDMINNMEYMQIPELNEDFIQINMNEMAGAGSGMNVADITGRLSEVMKKLPSAETFGAMLNRYIDIFLDNLKNVTRSTVTLEEGDLQQECTAVTVKIYEEDAKAVVKAILETAKADQDLKKAIDAISELADQDLYPDFLQGIEDALAEINEPEDDDDDDAMEYIEIVTYVDKEHNIIGREFRSDDAEDVPVVYYTVTSGENFAFKSAAEGFAVTGKGTKKDGKTSATYKLNVGGTDYLTMGVKDLMATEQELTGDIRLEPTAQLLSQMFGSTSGLPFADLALDIKLAADGVQLKVLGNDALIVGMDVKVNVKETADGDISFPSYAVNVNDQETMQEWVNSMDVTAVLNNLKAAGVPQELIDMILGSIG